MRDRLCRFGPVLAGLLIAGLSRDAQAGGSWRHVGPWDGDVATMDCSPISSGLCFAGTVGGLFRTTDGGIAWTFSGSQIPDIDTRVVVVDPTDADIAYAGTATAGVWKSSDRGATWRATSTGISGTQADRLAVAPSDPSRLLAFVGYQLWRSTDGAANWSSAATGLGGSGSSVRTIAFDPEDESIAYLATSAGSRVFKSTDGGSSWSASGTGFPMTVPSAIAIDPAPPTAIFVSTSGFGVWRSTDGAATWSSASGGLGGNDVRDLALSGAGGDLLAALYGGTSGGVWRSTDRGGSWAITSGGVGSPNVRAVVRDRTPAGRIFSLCDCRGISRSTDGGASWTTAGVGVAARFLYSVAVAPTNPRTLYAGSANPCGLAKSTDGGLSWADSSGSLGATRVSRVVTRGANGDLVWAGNSLGVHRSTDGGSTWWNSPTSPRPASFLAVDPSNSSTLYAASSGYDALRKSTDDGVTWTVSSTGLSSIGVNALAFDPVDPATIYLASNMVYPGVAPGDGPQSPDSGGRALYKSTDGAATWTEISASIPDSGTYGVVIDPSDHTTLHAATSGQGVYRSTDSGATWAPAWSGVSLLAVRALAAAPRALWAAAWGPQPGGVYWSRDGGANWNSLLTGLVDPLRFDFVVDPGGDDLWVTSRSGVALFQPTPPLEVPALSAAKNADGTVHVDWTEACSAEFHAFYSAPLGNPPLAWTAVDCDLGSALSLEWPAPDGSFAFVLAGQGNLAGREGSYGRGSDGTEMPAATIPCAPQAIAATCP